jgi:hypothetical protein
MRPSPLCALLLTALATVAEASSAEEQELPKVLYVVPWREVAVERSMPPLQADAGDNRLVPLDREVVRRQLRRRESERSRKAESAPPSGPADD